MKEQIVLKSFEDLSLSVFQKEVQAWDRQQHSSPTGVSLAKAARVKPGKPHAAEAKRSIWRIH